METIFYGEGGQYFTLQIERYESADAKDQYDANWLMMRGKVQSRADEWEFLDPCLMAWEYQYLANWLRTIESPESEPGLRFIEINLMFYKETIKGEPALVVEFCQECLPPHLRKVEQEYDGSTIYPYHEWNVIFPFRLNDFQEAADVIEEQLKQFPIRKPDGFNNGPSFADPRIRDLVCVVKNKDGRYVFITNDKDHLDDYFLETLGYEAYTSDDYEIMKLDALKKSRFLKPGEMDLLEQDGKVELWDSE